MQRWRWVGISSDPVRSTGDSSCNGAYRHTSCQSIARHRTPWIRFPADVSTMRIIPPHDLLPKKPSNDPVFVITSATTLIHCFRFRMGKLPYSLDLKPHRRLRKHRSQVGMSVDPRSRSSRRGPRGQCHSIYASDCFFLMQGSVSQLVLALPILMVLNGLTLMS